MRRSLREHLLTLPQERRSFKRVNKYLHEVFAIKMRGFTELMQATNNGDAVLAGTGLACGADLSVATRRGKFAEEQRQSPQRMADPLCVEQGEG